MEDITYKLVFSCRTVVTLLLIVRLRTAVFHEATVSIN